jgi:hypothetical protein
MTPTIELRQLFAYHGPNICGPQPGVLLRVRCNADRANRLRDALKDGAQFVGMVLAHLRIESHPIGDAFDIGVHFTTPTPDLGRDLATYVVDGIRAEAAANKRDEQDDNEDDDEEPEWERDAPLYELQKRRRQQALPLPALQLEAEAHTRNLPVLHLPDGTIQFGYGAHSWCFDPSALPRRPALIDDDEEHQPIPAPPWEQISGIPLYVVTGEQQRRALVEDTAARLEQYGLPIHTLHDADYAATLGLLSDPAVRCAVVGLDTADILRRGLAFEYCTQSIITDLNGEQPTEAVSTTEWARALGVPMLISNGPTLLNSSDPALAELAAFAPHGVAPLDAPDAV